MTLPTKQGMNVTTLKENQGAATIQIYEGESELTRENKLIGRIDLKDIPSGFPKIQITIDVDINFNISVHEKSVGVIKLTDLGAKGVQNVFEKNKMVYPIKKAKSQKPKDNSDFLR